VADLLSVEATHHGEGAGDGGVLNEVVFGKNDGENGGVAERSATRVQLGHVCRLVFALCGELTRLGILAKGLAEVGIAVGGSTGKKSWYIA